MLYPLNNYMSREFVNMAEHLYETMASSYRYSPALKPLWMVWFELPIIMGGEGYEGGYSADNKKGNNVDLLYTENAGSSFGSPSWARIWEDKQIAAAPQWMNNHGIMYATQMNIPGDTYNVSRTNVNDFGRGEPSGLIGTGRADFAQFGVDFIETNSSFTDMVMRPWLILAAANGLKIQSVKTNVHAIFLQKDGSGENSIRKAFTFHDAFPNTIGSERYDQRDGLVTRSCNFIYNWYSMRGPDILETLYPRGPDTT